MALSRSNLKCVLLLLLLGVTLSSCLSWKVAVNHRDPFENYNRKIYAFNDKVYYVLKPVAKVYDVLIPDFLQTGIFNIFQNLVEPVRIVNDILQGQWGYAGDDIIRFLANTTLGIGGCFDVADSWFNKPMRYYQNFAVTLHKWGVYGDGEASPYIVWPFVGPGTLEDFTLSIDSLFNPLTYVFFFAPMDTAASYSASLGVYATYQLNQSSSYLSSYSNLKEVSIDPYIAIRNAYLQNYDYRTAKVLKQQSHENNTNIQVDETLLTVIGLECLESK